MYGKIRKSIRRNYIAVTVIFIILSFLMSALLPYIQLPEISKEVKDMFNMNNFYGDEQQHKERVMLLTNPKEAFAHRINIINKAEKEINFTTHAVYNGYSTYMFFAALLEAADRGVKVNVTVDGKFAGIKKEIKNALIAHENIRFIDYNPLNLFRLRLTNVALHEKILTVDSKYMIVGGRNMGSRFFAPDDYNGVLTMDREVLVYSESGNSASIDSVDGHFERLSASSLAKERVKVTKAQKRKAAKERSAIKEIYNIYMDEHDLAQYNYNALTMEVDKITVLTNPVSGAAKSPTLAYNLYNMAMESRKVVIQTPYAVLTNKHMQYLKEINRNCEEVRLVTNTLGNTPNPPAFSNYYVNRKKLLKTGTKIYEYQGDGNVHAKAYLFDDRLSAVGSFNLDERSIGIDTEIMLVIDSVEFQQHLRADIDFYFNQSLLIGADNKFVPDENVTPAKISGAKKFFYPILGFFLNIVKVLL